MIAQLGLFAITAFFEILGCYSVLQVTAKNHPWRFGVLAVVSLLIFAYLLTLHESEAGRVYAAYGGIYVLVSLVWLWLVDGVTPTTTDLIGVALTLCGTCVIVAGFVQQK